MSLLSEIGSGLNDGFIVFVREEKETLTLAEGLLLLGTLLRISHLLSFNSLNCPVE